MFGEAVYLTKMPAYFLQCENLQIYPGQMSIIPQNLRASYTVVVGKNETLPKEKNCNRSVR